MKIRLLLSDFFSLNAIKLLLPVKTKQVDIELNSKKSNWADLYILYYKLPFIKIHAVQLFYRKAFKFEYFVKILY